MSNPFSPSSPTSSSRKAPGSTSNVKTFCRSMACPPSCASSARRVETTMAWRWGCWKVDQMTQNRTKVGPVTSYKWGEITPISRGSFIPVKPIYFRPFIGVIYIYMGVVKTPKMDFVKIMENPYEQMDDLGGFTIIFGNTHIYNPYKWPKINGFHWDEIALLIGVVSPHL